MPAADWTVRGAVVITAAALAVAACSSGPAGPANSAAADGPPRVTGPVPVLQAGIAAGLLPAPVARAVVLPDGGDLMIMGGLDAAGGTVPGVFRLDPATGVTARAGSLPRATHDAAGAVIGGADVVFGGGSLASTATVQAWRPGRGGRVCTVIQDEDDGVIRGEHVRV